MPKFILEINLGNDEMRSDEDIAYALENVAERVRDDSILLHPASKRITDTNGNVVGSYKVVE